MPGIEIEKGMWEYTTNKFRTNTKEALDRVADGDLVIINREGAKFAVISYDGQPDFDGGNTENEIRRTMVNEKPLSRQEVNSDLPPADDEGILPPVDIAKEIADSVKDEEDPWADELEPQETKYDHTAPYGRHRCGCAKQRLRHLCEEHSVL